MRNEPTVPYFSGDDAPEVVDDDEVTVMVLEEVREHLEALHRLQGDLQRRVDRALASVPTTYDELHDFIGRIADVTCDVEDQLDYLVTLADDLDVAKE